MNNKIKQLAKESELNSDEVLYHLTDYDEYEYSNVEQFAKLLILECCKVMEDKDSFYGEWMGNVIKQHFEVKDEITS